MKHLARLIADNLQAAAREVAAARQQPHGPRFNLLSPRLESRYRAPKRLATHAKRCAGCGRLTFSAPSRCASPSCTGRHTFCSSCQDDMAEGRYIITMAQAEQKRRAQRQAHDQIAALMMAPDTGTSH